MKKPRRPRLVTIDQRWVVGAEILGDRTGAGQSYTVGAVGEGGHRLQQGPQPSDVSKRNRSNSYRFSSSSTIHPAPWTSRAIVSANRMSVLKARPAVSL
jgi:hypothetical protein